MDDTKRNDYQPSPGVVYGSVGVLLIVLGGVSLANTNEAAGFGVLGLAFLASGFYVTLAGAVARGIQMARR